ncbi:hypothetical protein TGVAND_235430 [Toxoplasma gondii VAND]|nr:hypothetical protein TGVAND_235430 [Toxoplasma gondii VAND]
MNGETFEGEKNSGSPRLASELVARNAGERRREGGRTRLSGRLSGEAYEARRQPEKLGDEGGEARRKSPRVRFKTAARVCVCGATYRREKRNTRRGEQKKPAKNQTRSRGWTGGAGERSQKERALESFRKATRFCSTNTAETKSRERAGIKSPFSAKERDGERSRRDTKETSCFLRRIEKDRQWTRGDEERKFFLALSPGRDKLPILFSSVYAEDASSPSSSFPSTFLRLSKKRKRDGSGRRRPRKISCERERSESKKRVKKSEQSSFPHNPLLSREGICLPLLRL